MARTKGARDKSIRKKPAAKRPPIKRDPPTETPRPEAQSGPPNERPPLPATDFKAAIAAELHQQTGEPLPPGQRSAPQPADVPNAGQASFEPGTLTIEGLEAAFQVPFFVLSRVLAWLRIAPDPAPIRELGQKRAKVLAKPAYAIYEHYARAYLGLHPDNGVHVAIGVTGLNAVGISPELVEAIEESRRRAALRVAPPVPVTTPAA